MILEFGARNFYSFKEGFSVSFRLDKNCPPSISLGKDTTSILGVKGANGSGKTNVLKALSFIADFAANSFSLAPEAEIPVRPFFSSEDPIELYLEFKVDDTEYVYELGLEKKRVVKEILSRVKGKKYRLFERSYQEIIHTKSAFNFIHKMNIRENVSIISTAHQYQYKAMEVFHKFFVEFTSNVYIYGRYESNPDERVISSLYNRFPKDFKMAKDIIRDADLGIDDIEILQVKGEEEYYIPIFTHQTGKKGDFLTYYEQSSGTKALYRYLIQYQWALMTGGVLILDEFDVNLHPMILPKLLDLFVNEETNSKGAQIIFTTHDSNILDYLGKYRVYMVNKEMSESFGYRLDEIPGDMLRNDRPISTIYNQKKIGGVPNLG